MHSSNYSSTTSAYPSTTPVDHGVQASGVSQTNKAALAQEKLKEGWSSIQAAALLAKEHVEEKLPKSLKKKFQKQKEEQAQVVYFDEMEPGSRPTPHILGSQPVGAHEGAFSYEHGRAGETDEGIPFSSGSSYSHPSSSYDSSRTQPSYDSSRVTPSSYPSAYPSLSSDSSSSYDSSRVQPLPTAPAVSYDSNRGQPSSASGQPSYNSGRMQPSSYDSNRPSVSSYDPSRGQPASAQLGQVKPQQGADGLLHIYNGRVQEVPYEHRSQASQIPSGQAYGHGTTDTRKPGMFEKLKQMVSDQRR